MNSATAPTIAAIVIQIGLGLAVFQANPRRKSNQCFLLLSCIIGAWLGCIYRVVAAHNVEVASFYIREASAAGAITLTIFNLLRLSILKPNQSWSEISRDSWIW